MCIDVYSAAATTNNVNTNINATNFITTTTTNEGNKGYVVATITINLTFTIVHHPLPCVLVTAFFALLFGSFFFTTIK